MLRCCSSVGAGSADRGCSLLHPLVQLRVGQQGLLPLLCHQEASNLFTEHLKVKVSSQQFTGLCEVRVRVQPAVPPNQHWSNWSPTTSWFGAAETAGTAGTRAENDGTVWTGGLMHFTAAALPIEVLTKPNLSVSEWLLDQTGLLSSLGVVVVVVLLLSAGCWGKRSVCVPVRAAQ